MSVLDLGDPLDAAPPEASDAVDEAALVALRDALILKLRAQREAAEEFYAWYRCRQMPPAMPAAADYTPPFERMRRQARGAWARLVIDAIAERLVVQGVQTTAGEDADTRAWKLLQDNRIDSDQRDVHTEALIVGVSYVSVGAGADGSATITPETALEVTHLAVPGDRRLVDAALKVMPQGGGRWLAELYRPEFTASWTASYRDGRRSPLVDGARAGWDDLVVVPNDLGDVAVVPFENRPTVATPGLSELDELIPIMERIQELELAKLIGVYTVTFPQKWATGLRVERGEDGRPKNPFVSGPQRLWVADGPNSADAKFGAFPQGDIGQYLRAIDDEVAELAAISRVPSYYLVQSDLANPPSSESLITSETGLLTKCLDRQRSYGEAWEQVVRLAARAAGDATVAADRELEVLWHTPERRNPAVIADAATKLQAVGVPTEAVWSFLGYSPQAVARMRVEAEAEAIRQAALAPPPAAPPPA